MARLGGPAALGLLSDVAQVAAAHAGRRGRQIFQVVAAELLRVCLQNLLPASSQRRAAGLRHDQPLALYNVSGQELHTRRAKRREPRTTGTCAGQAGKCSTTRDVYCTGLA